MLAGRSQYGVPQRSIGIDLLAFVDSVFYRHVAELLIHATHYHVSLAGHACVHGAFGQLEAVDGVGSLGGNAPYHIARVKVLDVDFLADLVEMFLDLLCQKFADVVLQDVPARVPAFGLPLEEFLAGTFPGPLIKHIAEVPRKAYEACADVAESRIYHCKDVVDIEIAGYKVITQLTDLMIKAVTEPDKAFSKLLINRVSSQYQILAPTLYERVMAVLDYISGMTDVYALDLYRKINGMSLPDV